MSPDASITRIWDRDIVETRRRVRNLDMPLARGSSKRGPPGWVCVA
jgi:hypothetical protein